MAKMNSLSLYVTTNQMILKSDPANATSWQDLYRLLPYLRNSLCCVVCSNLLIEPMTPSAGKCHHHLCRKCKCGRKKIKPACMWCKDATLYTENKTLRTLLHCYKRMCLMLINSGIFRTLAEQASKGNTASGVERGAGNLIMLIKEGAAFQDDYQMSIGLSKAVYSILPCIYTNSSTQTLQTTEAPRDVHLNSNLRNVSNGTALYSVMFGESGNKITIKRKDNDATEGNVYINNIAAKKDPVEKAIFKKPANKCILKPRRGCRCGNATATPGKLTCCGQRCPCYVESKACIECKCRGCRNPHRSDGFKVRPLIPQIQFVQQVPGQQQQLLQNVNIEIDPNLTMEQLNKHLKSANIKVMDSYSKVSTTLPHTILMNDGTASDDEEEITVV